MGRDPFEPLIEPEGDDFDVLQWKLEDVPISVREDMGPAFVWKGQILLREFPWHVYGHIEVMPGPKQGWLFVLDVSGGHVRELAHYEPGQWTDFNRRAVPSGD